MLRSESDLGGMGDPGPSMPPEKSTNSEELFKAFLADCEGTSASREQTAPPEEVVSQERHPNPAPIPPAQVPADPASHEQDPVGRAALISPEGEVFFWRNEIAQQPSQKKEINFLLPRGRMWSN